MSLSNFPGEIVLQCGGDIKNYGTLWKCFGGKVIKGRIYLHTRIHVATNQFFALVILE